MFEEIFNDDVLNEIDRRSDELIERYGIDPDRNCWVIMQGYEDVGLKNAPTTSAQLTFELEDKVIGECLIEVYEQDNRYIIYTYNKDFLHRVIFGHSDAKIVTKDQLPETIGEITHIFVNTILDKGI